jgi:hypothetical protein
MHLTIRRYLAALLVAVVLAGCGGSAQSPSPAPSDGHPPGGFLLRATTTQALPPESRFGWFPTVAITGDRVLVLQGAVPAIYPGPLLAPLFGRLISDAGYGRIVERAMAFGLLTGNGDFTPPDVAPGQALGKIEIVVDGTMRVLVGDPSRVIMCIQAPCDPAPGTPEAFGSFWQALSDLPSWLGADLGPEAPYVAQAVALLIEPPVVGDADIPARVSPWPLGGPLADVGRPIGGGQLPRCATIRGDDAQTLLAAFANATQLTNWADAGTDPPSAVFLQVRPLLPGEDACAELFGITE